MKTSMLSFYNDDKNKWLLMLSEEIGGSRFSRADYFDMKPTSRQLRQWKKCIHGELRVIAANYYQTVVDDTTNKKLAAADSSKS